MIYLAKDMIILGWLRDGPKAALPPSSMLGTPAIVWMKLIYLDLAINNNCLFAKTIQGLFHILEVGINLNGLRCLNVTQNIFFPGRKFLSLFPSKLSENSSDALNMRTQKSVTRTKIFRCGRTCASNPLALSCQVHQVPAAALQKARWPAQSNLEGKSLSTI